VTRKRDVIIYLLAVGATAILLWRFLGVEAQIIAGTVFVATVLGTLAFWRFRLAIAFAGIATLLATGTLSIERMIFYMNIDVITFLISMMILVYVAKESGFFTWLLGKMLRFTNNDPVKVLIILLIMSTLMAALVDEVTSILFIIAVSFEYCKYFELNPFPYTISTVLATNVGSSATMLGNPVGILIGLRGGLSFEDFLIWAAPVALMSLGVIILLSVFWYRKDLKAAKFKVAEKMKTGETSVFGSVPPEKMNDVKISGILLFATVIMIALHHRIELAFNIEEFIILLAAAYTGAAIGLLWKRGKAQHIVERGVDWWTLLFFMFLFAKAGALQYTHLTDVLAAAISSTATSQPQIQTFVVWFSGIASSLMDNVVLVAALIPVVNSLIALGYNGFPLWFALLFGGVYGGNITMIGSTANIVAIGMLEKNFSYHMKFFKWFWIGLLGGFLPMLIGTLWLLLFFH
jgi:Na+/H+ antiporter NhaD/arsenite permease-like protein